MKTKNLVILAAVVAAIAAYIFFFERHRQTTDELEQQSERVLQDFDRDEVVEISIERAAGPLRLEKEGETWRLLEPIDFPADAAKVTSTLGSLADLETDRRLDLAEIDLAEYGLDAPAATVKLGMRDGREIGIQVGAELPLGTKRAVVLAGGDELFVTPGWFVSSLERELDDWRSRDVAELSTDGVASIEIFTDDDSIRAVRDGGRWLLERPLRDVADGEHIGNVIADLNQLRIEEFLDGGVDASELGLVTPEYEIQVVRTDGDEPLRLNLGATREVDGQTQVACRRGDDLYFWAIDRVRTRLSKAPVLWRSAKVAPFETWAATGLEISRDGETVQLSGGEVPWQFPDGVEANLSAVQDRLSKIADLEATDFDLMAPLTEELGFAKITLEEDEESSTAPVLIYTFYKPLAEGGKVMVRVSDRENIMGVDAEAAAGILGNLDSLRPIDEAEVSIDEE